MNPFETKKSRSVVYGKKTIHVYHMSGQMIIIYSPEMLGHFGMIPLINHDSRVRENSEVVIICPDMCVCVRLLCFGTLSSVNAANNQMLYMKCYCTRSRSFMLNLIHGGALLCEPSWSITTTTITRV